jgi:hypothetical protein
MTAYQPGEWESFFIAATGASAALAGLVIVALSVNMQKILAFPHLPPRAAAAIGMLVLILISSMAGLIHQPVASFGIELMAFGVMGWLLQDVAARNMLRAHARSPAYRRASLQAIILGQVQALLFVVGGISLYCGQGGGLYWIAAGVIAIFIFSMIEAWVLLVEILR